MRWENLEMNLGEFLAKMTVDGWDFYNRSTVRAIGVTLEQSFSELGVDLSTPIHVRRYSGGNGGKGYRYIWYVDGVPCPIPDMELWEERYFKPSVCYSFFGFSSLPFIRKTEKGFEVGYNYP